MLHLVSSFCKFYNTTAISNSFIYFWANDQKNFLCELFTWAKAFSVTKNVNPVCSNARSRTGLLATKNNSEIKELRGRKYSQANCKKKPFPILHWENSFCRPCLKTKNSGWNYHGLNVNRLLENIRGNKETECKWIRSWFYVLPTNKL